MADVLTRVELHGYPEDSAQYRNLHTLMEDAGFYRTIGGGDGKTYKLPHATYYSSQYATTRAANAAAIQAAAGIITTKGHGVISGGVDLWIGGLQEVVNVRR
jgi:hypothetical protein